MKSIRSVKFIPFVSFAIGLACAAAILSPIPEKNSLPTYLFFIMQALSIYKEFHSSEAKRVFLKTNIVFAVLLTISGIVFWTSLLFDKKPSKGASKGSGMGKASAMEE